MKNKLKTFLFVLSNILILNLIGQNPIGSYDVFESNGTYFHNAGNSNTNKIDTKHIVLKYNRNVSSATITTFEQNKNITLFDKYKDFYIYIIPENIEFITFCQDLENSSIVSYIELSIYFKLYGGFFPNDFDNDDQWYLDILDLPETWMLTKGNPDVTVAILDTGLDYDDEEFGPEDTQISNIFHNDPENDWDDWDEPDSGNEYNDDGNGYFTYYDTIEYIDDWQGLDLNEIIYNYNSNNDNLTYIKDTIDNDVRPAYPEQSNPNYVEYEDPQHGNWLAGIVAAKTNNDNEYAGMAGGDTDAGTGGVKILPIKLTDWRFSAYDNGWYSSGAYTVNVMMAIKYAISLDVDVINMSFGMTEGGSSQGLLDNAILEAWQNNIVIVAASGNENHEYNNGYGNVSYPAKDTNIISVGATDQADEYWDDSPNWGSNEGYQLELMAPGVDIGAFDESGLVGTSFSAAMVSATAALMKSVNPNLTNQGIREILRLTTYQNPDYDFDNTNNSFDPYPRGWNEHFGFGRINTLHAVCAALDSLPQDIITNNNDIWDEPTYSKQDIIIESGAKLTITSTLMMDPSAKIIIEPGGKLIVDGGTITNMPYCAGDSLKWRGIEVSGDTSKSQRGVNGNYDQGYLELRNGATIKNAQTAVLLGEEGDYYGSGGGIIKAYNSSFINNAKSLHFYRYKNMIKLGDDPAFEGNNEAVIKYCTFEINENYFPDSQFYKHADIVGVKGVQFIASSFKRLSTENTSPWCAGIASYHAGISVKDYQDDSTKFEGFYTGIIISDNSTTIDYDSYIRNSVFENNSIGIKLNGLTNLVSIRENTFKVGYNETDKGICGTSQGFGIYLDNSNTFIIEDNYFEKYNQAPPNGEYFGIEAFNTQTSTDEIFSNTFEDLTHANHATNQNWETYPHIGLTYYCNINSSNVNDFFFTYDGDYQTYLASGVQTGQGDTTKSAGNTFTPNISGFNIFNNTSHGVGYYYNSNIPIEQPLVYSGNGIVTTHGQNLTASCSGGISPKELTEQEKSAIETDYLAYESSYESIKSLYETLEDGGNTDELQTEVISSWPNEMWELRAELLDLSPYLSTDVLKTVADKTEVLPESVLFEILSANPEELKKEELMSYLENKEEPLPDYMIEILRQLALGQSTKSILQNQLAQYHRAKSRSAMAMLACLPYDEVFDYSNYRLWLSRLGGINNDRRIVASFIEEENYTDALSLANMLPELYELEEQALVDHEFYIDLLEFNINLKQTNRSPLEITEEEFALIEYIAQNSTSASGVNAKAILEHFYDQHFCNCVNTSVDVNKSANASIDPNQFAEAMGLFITADPNPATTWVSFNYQLPIGKEKAVLTITNTEAKQIAQFIFTSEVGQKVWDTRSINAGTYIYEYICDDLKQNGKIVIIK